MRKIQVVAFGSHSTTGRIAKLLQSNPQIEVCSTASSPRELLQAVGKDHPEVVVLEVVPELREAMTLIEHMPLQNRQPRLMILAHDLNMSHVRQAVDAGAMGYLLLRPALEGLSTAIQLVCAGKFTVSPEITSLLLTSAKP